MQYTPNFSDPRVYSRVRAALGLANSWLRADRARQFPVSIMDSEFGRTGSNINLWLRDQLLINTNPVYNMHTGKCKEYKLNYSSALELAAIVYPELDISPTQGANIEAVALSYLNSRHDPLDNNYTERCHRLFHPVQNIPKELRRVYLAEHGLKHQYDISSAAPTIVYQASMREGGSAKPTVKRFIDDKAQIRQHYSTATGLSISSIKQILVILFAGGTLGNNRDMATYHLCEGNPDIISYLQQDSDIQQLKAEIKQMWGELRHLLPETTATSANGRTRSTQMSSSNKWVYYFSQERQVLDSIMRYLDSQTMNYFLIHDAFVSNYEVDTNYLSEWVYKETGYELMFD